MTQLLIPEAPNNPYRLGRHVNHDERSRAFAWSGFKILTLRTLAHRSYGLPLDHGNLGSCTGNALVGSLNTVPVHLAGAKVLRESDAVTVYHTATVLDPFDGEWPPTDTGSDGLSACKAAQKLGLLKEYRWGFGIDQAIQALQRYPVITGVPWFEGMFYPTKDGFVRPGGQVAGGHEFLVRGYVAAAKPYVLCMNSWGTDWGLGGKFKLFVDDWATLLQDNGDVTVLVR